MSSHDTAADFRQRRERSAIDRYQDTVRGRTADLRKMRDVPTTPRQTDLYLAADADDAAKVDD